MFERRVIPFAVFAIALSGGTPASGAERTQVAAASQADMAALPLDKSVGSAKSRSELDGVAVSNLLEAQLKLAARHASNVNDSASQTRAFELYRQIVKEHADIRPGDARSRGISQAYVALGGFYRSGISGSLAANKARAASLLHFAASFYGNADAQCDLALMYLDGEGHEKDERLAASWLANAAKKRHARAQALLGNLLVRGGANLKSQPDKGLALLALARQNASGDTQARWIEGLYRGALEQLEPAVLERADRIAANWQNTLGSRNRVISIESRPAKSVSAGNDRAPRDNGVMQVGMENAPVAR